MEVRPGYKQTEVGVIPEDWNPDYIENFAVITTGSKNTQDRIEDGEYPFFVRSQTVERINSYSFDGEAVLTAGDGVGTGKVFHYINGRFDVHQRVYRISNFAERVNGFFFYLYFSTHFFNRIMQMTAKSSVDSVRRDMIARMLVPLPPTEAEQRAIAQALSNMDALLGALDRLIAKKRDLKQAVMQQLLTGQTRLPGFRGEWKNTNLGKIISRFSTGLNPRQNFRLNDGGNFFYVTIKNFTVGQLLLDDGCDLIDEAAFLTINQRSDLRKDDILFSSIGRVGDAYLIPETPRNWNINESVFTLRPDKTQVVPLMLFYLLTNKALKDALDQGVTGSTFKSIKQAQLKVIPCRLPTSHEEQTAIAETLRDMDAELAKLEHRRGKTRDLKQGMMQELLTGRNRLI